MKLASLKYKRDGQLVVVSSDLKRMVKVGNAFPTMQSAIDEWNTASVLLQQIFDKLERDHSHGEEFKFESCASPLPRAFHWADGSAYVNHVELVRKARNVEMPESFWTDPLMYQGGSDTFLDPYSVISFPLSNGYGIDFEAEIAVITDDVPMGVTPSDALQHIKLVMLVNDVSLRGLIPQELSKGFGFYQSKPSSAFSPVCVTPEQLGAAWDDGKLCLPLRSVLNGSLFGKPNAGLDMTFNFGQLIAHAAKTRNLGAGTIIGSGTVSNKLNGGSGKKIEQGGNGYSCIAEIRMIETIENGTAQTPFMTNGDHIKIEMLDKDGTSIFGSIVQNIVSA